MRVTVKKLAMSGQSDHLELVWDKTIWFGFNQAHTNSEIQSTESSVQYHIFSIVNLLSIAKTLHVLIH